MSKLRYIILLLCSLLVVTGAEGAQRHTTQRRHTVSRSYHKKRTTHRRSSSTRRTTVRRTSVRPKTQTQVEDSLLNSPKEKAAISYSDKDIPLDFVIDLDSTLNIYKTSMKLNSEPCDDNDSLAKIPLTDSAYMARLGQIPSIMKLSYNNIVKDYIKLYTIRKRELTSYILGQKDYYFPMFSDALEKEGLPLELVNLPVIESALNPRAYSVAGASGLWQFITSTGRMYGLTVNSLVDERRDPVKATRAAAKYLKHLYGIYKDWTLVIAAYNCGPGNVNKAIRRAGGVKDYWAIYYNLPKETRGYVPAFIAATYALHFYKEHNICPKDIKHTLAVDTIEVSDRVHLGQISAVLDIDMDELRNLNPQYRRDIIPGNGKKYTLSLPANKLNQFEMYKNTILAYNIPNFQGSASTYVQPGLNAYNKNKGESQPAAKTDSASQNGDAALVASNLPATPKPQNTTRPNTARQQPNRSNTNAKNIATEKTGSKATIEKKAAGNQLTAATTQKATTQRNDSANKTTSQKKQQSTQPTNGTSVTQLATNSQQKDSAVKATPQTVEKKETPKLANRIVDKTKKEGEQRNLSGAMEYKVRSGDTLYSIAARNKVTVNELKEWNSLNSDNLQIGQKIVIKQD